MDGLLNLDKPRGISSARAVSRVKRMLTRGVKVGHAGTLDPFATGVLLILIGRATRWCERLMDEPKQYQATVKLGATTATDDCESPECPVENVGVIDRLMIESCLPRFIGFILQRPPDYSAMKIGGRRAYGIARGGGAVMLQPRPVRIDRIELLEFNWPYLRLSIDCGRGAYIRSLARDLGEALGAGGYLTALRRTRVGRFEIGQSMPLENLAPHLLEASIIASIDGPGL